MAFDNTFIPRFKEEKRTIGLFPLPFLFSGSRIEKQLRPCSCFSMLNRVYRVLWF
ncbi:hypothetical protein B4096_1959 [Heyndrickxia coagulans]|nr:hypothetical protein B4100_2049 [Heyndrickxia coagulans]KYC91158.1 hypothetical protein B4096_1959 [Heyndrickxia coagulans]